MGDRGSDRSGPVKKVKHNANNRGKSRVNRSPSTLNGGNMKKLLLSGVAAFALPGMAAAASCPAVTVADMQGVAAGAFPQQFELAELQGAAS